MFPATCVFFVLMVLCFILASVLRKTLSDQGDAKFGHLFAVWSGVLAGTIALLLGVSSSITTVSTKNLGVLTTWGRPSGYLTNGIHFKLPWQDVTELSDAIQTDTYADDHCVNVRIARQTTACVNVSIRWQIRGSGADYLFRNYRSNDYIADNLVLRDLQTALNEAFVNFDPLGIDPNGLSTNVPLSALKGPSIAAGVLTQMQNEIGTWIEVQSVNIPLIRFDDSTQGRLNQLQQQIAATRVAQQAKLTAAAQAEANKALGASVAQSPLVLTDKCLNLLREAVDKGQALPAGFSCFPGNTTPVAVSAKP